MLDPATVSWGAQLYSNPQSLSQVHSGSYQYQGTSLPVAIKTLRLTEDQLGSTIQELLIQSRLEDCPFICRLYGYFLANSQICIVSEALGLSLEEDLAQREGKSGYLEWELLTMLADLLEALIFAQRKSIAHRDIKPQNILLTSNPPFRVKLVDFGSGCLVDGQVQRLTGTPLYMSPEQIPALQQYQATGDLPASSSDPYSADVYSLGVTFLHLALAETPIKLLLNQREAAVEEYLARVKPDYPRLFSCLEPMLRTNPTARPTFEELQNTLKSFQPDREEPQSSLESVPFDHFAGTPIESFTQEQRQEYLQYWTTESFLSQPHSLDNLSYIFTSSLFARFTVQVSVHCDSCFSALSLCADTTECAVHGLLCAVCVQTHSPVQCRVCGLSLPLCLPPGKLYICKCETPVMLGSRELG